MDIKIYNELQYDGLPEFKLYKKRIVPINISHNLVSYMFLVSDPMAKIGLNKIIIKPEQCLGFLHFELKNRMVILK